MSESRSDAEGLPRIPDHSPTVAGRWLANDLRKLRTAANMKQEDAAKELRCNRAKVSFLESGHTPVRRPDLLVLLPLYGVPHERQQWYLDLCDEARERGWWDGADGVPSWFSLYLGLEWGAEKNFSYDLGALPGLLQTREYARAVMTSGFRYQEEKDAERVVEQRIQRQQAIDRSEMPLQVHAILDEAAVRHEVGGYGLMRTQRVHLVDMADHPQVTIQIMPFTAGAHSGHTGAFQILDFPSADDPGVVYLETRCGGLYLEENDELHEYRRVASELMKLALDEVQSKSFLKKLARSRI